MILTTIDGIPLYSTVQEAVQWASSRGLTGYHTHIYQGQTGYMGGSNHDSVATPTITPRTIARASRSSSSSGGGY
jgi:hypothetical protein